MKRRKEIEKDGETKEREGKEEGRKGLEELLTIKSTDHSCRGPWSSAQNTHGTSQLPITSVPRESEPSSGFHGLPA